MNRGVHPGGTCADDNGIESMDGDFLLSYLH
jgi:hypothetical protein